MEYEEHAIEISMQDKIPMAHRVFYLTQLLETQGLRLAFYYFCLV